MGTKWTRSATYPKWREQLVDTSLSVAFSALAPTYTRCARTSATIVSRKLSSRVAKRPTPRSAKNPVVISLSNAESRQELPKSRWTDTKMQAPPIPENAEYYIIYIMRSTEST
jgi:hypothetical protein